MNILETHFTSSICINIRIDGIIETRGRAGKSMRLDRKHAEENVEKVRELKEDRELLLIFIDNGRIGYEARVCYQSTDLIFKKVAMVAKGPVQQLLGNFFLGIHRPKMPIKMFIDEASAVSWLKS